MTPSFIRLALRLLLLQFSIIPFALLFCAVTFSSYIAGATARLRLECEQLVHEFSVLLNRGAHVVE